MTRKDQILIEKLKSNGLSTKIIPDTLFWNVITDCMQQYCDEKESEFDKQTISDVVNLKEFEAKKEKKPHEHEWLYCGYGFYICADESCGEYLQK